MERLKVNIKYYVLVVIMYVLVFQSVLQKYIPIFQYFDECLAILAIPIICFRIFKRKMVKKYDMIIAISLFFIFIIGIYANLTYKYQSIYIALCDAISVYKFFLVYYLTKIINYNDSISSIKDRILKHIKFLIILFFILTIVNYGFKIFPNKEFRYGIMTNKLFFGQPTALVAVSVFLLSLLILFEEKVNTRYTYMLGIIIFSTLRMKGITFLFAFILISIYVTKMNKKITISKIGIIVVFCFLIAFDRIEYYFLTSDNFARTALLKSSIKIANDYFPIGAGFATFASHFSAVSYSPLYSLYRIQNVYGLTKNNSAFVSDSFWPMLLGQFGYLGTMLYIICILIIFKKIQVQYEIQGKYKYLAKITVLAYLIISSTSESAFVNPMSISLAIILGL